MVVPTRPSDASLRCVPAADLTAFAQDALPEPRRAEISRHLLRCPRCNAAASGTGDLLSRLRSFGAAASWGRRAGRGRRGRARTHARARASAPWRARASDCSSPRASRSSRARTLPMRASRSRAPRPRPPAPAAPPFPPERDLAVLRSGSASAPSLPLSAAAQALLRAQAADGHWTADDALGGGRHDEAATGLALLAILEGRPGAMRDPAVARAVAAATRWLRGRERGLDASPAAFRDEAVATSALLAVYAQTGDATVRASADRGVRRLAREMASASTLDAATAGWARVALARARDLGWDRGLPAPDGAPAAYPLGGTPGETLVAKALALVDRTPQG